MQEVDRKSPKSAKKIGAQHAIIHSSSPSVHGGRSKKNGTSGNAPDFFRSTCGTVVHRPTVSQEQKARSKQSEKEKLGAPKNSKAALLTFGASKSLKGISDTAPDWMSSPTTGKEERAADLQFKSKQNKSRELTLMRSQSNSAKCRGASVSAPEWMNKSSYEVA
jgi:hypothetical protein